MSNIITRPHSRHSMRFVSSDKKRQIQYDMDKRREEQGKKVIYLHEQPPKVKSKMPTSSEAEDMIVSFYNTHCKLPTKLFTSFRWPWPNHSFTVQGLAGHAWDVLGPYSRNGYFVPVDVFHDENIDGIRFE